MQSHHSRSTDSVTSTNSSLLSRARLAEPEAWRRLTTLYGPLVYKWARQASLQPEDAADVTQEVFQAVTMNIHRYERQANGGGFRGWLWTIARNKIRDHFRIRRGKAQAAGGTAGLEKILQLPQQTPDEDGGNDGHATNRVQWRALELVRGDFAEKTWQAFWRSTIDGDAPADVAADLEISVWTVYKARARVLSRLRDELAGLS